MGRFGAGGGGDGGPAGGRTSGRTGGRAGGRADVRGCTGIGVRARGKLFAGLEGERGVAAAWLASAVRCGTVRYGTVR